MRKIYLAIALTLVIVTLSVYGCAGVPQTSKTQPPISTTVISREERLTYQLITIQAKGNEASFSILPQQHYSVVLFVDKELKSDLNVYCTYIPSEAIGDAIFIRYFKPSDRANPDSFGTIISLNKTHFVLLAYEVGWYSIDFFYDILDSESASSLPPVEIFVRWDL